MSQGPSPSAPKPPATSSATMAQAARNRQIAYALGIVLLFGAMWPYSEFLAERKRTEDLGEATIGQIDTGGFMLKLFMIGGFRGIVVNKLWQTAHEYERVHEWDKLKSNVDFITKLQPHFLSIWTFQGWNLAYNVSVEWDAPEDKYVWIKKGINFLREGVSKNRDKPDLIWDTAWTYYHKLGFADEAIILRRLFRDDPDDDGSNFKREPYRQIDRDDNFLLGWGWFKLAVDDVDKNGGQRVDTNLEDDVRYVDRPTQHKGRPGDLAFRTMPAHAQTRYAAALEKQSVRDIPATFGGKAAAEWDRADKEWDLFGEYEWPAFRYEDQPVQVGWSMKPKALKTLTEPQKYWTDRWAGQTNFRFWKDRSQTEKTLAAVDARELLYNGTKALKSANFPLAVEMYGKGLVAWENVLKGHPIFRNDDLNKKDIRHYVRRYLLSLKQIGEKEPETHPFEDLTKGPEPDYTPDPFDQLEMTRTAPRTSPGGPAGPK